MKFVSIPTCQDFNRHSVGTLLLHRLFINCERWRRSPPSSSRLIGGGGLCRWRTFRIKVNFSGPEEIPRTGRSTLRKCWSLPDCVLAWGNDHNRQYFLQWRCWNWKFLTYNITFVNKVWSFFPAKNYGLHFNKLLNQHQDNIALKRMKMRASLQCVYSVRRLWLYIKIHVYWLYIMLNA